MRQPVYLPLVFLVLLSSCSERLYYPDRANVPAFREAHELKAVLSVKPQDFMDGGGSPACPAADVAYAPINHLGIIASYRTIVNRDAYLYPVSGKPENYSVYNTSVAINGHRFEGGAGYFTGLGRKGIFEIYGGYGNGVVKGQDKFTANYNRFFLQPEAGFRSSRISLMGGIRVAMQQYYKLQSPDSTLRYNIDTYQNGFNAPVDFLSQHFIFVEPFINFEVGYKYVSFNMQFGFTTQTGYYAPITSDLPVYASFGAVFQLSPSFNDRKKKGAGHAVE